jgi:lipopolysaccharide/colanic/teichoic acid biosynthesis glycosyltransferase
MLPLLAWPMAMLVTYGLRGMARSSLLARRCYGVPVVVVGNGESARRAIAELNATPEMGYVPVAVFTSELTAEHERDAIAGVPLVGRLEAASQYVFPYKVSHAVLAVGSGWEHEGNQLLARRLAERYPSLQIFSGLPAHGHWLARVRPIGPYITIETHHARFSLRQRCLKRLMDLVIAGSVLLVSMPALLIVACLILIIDPGPIFFAQVRDGRGGKPIRIYKLRSMIAGAEAKLTHFLAENDDARAEYGRTLKLRNDPRIIPFVGRFIRRMSLDELPQLWSILKGDMSLVGPRVFLKQEVEMYSDEGRALRRDVRPGLTGFWQVEHRSESDLRMREVADSFYVANWSAWLDLWILLRTIRVVSTGAGAF